MWTTTFDVPLAKNPPVQNWSTLNIGDSVEVLLADQTRYPGEIDNKTYDSEIVWVISSSGLGRRMHSNDDGTVLVPLTARSSF